MLGASPHGLNRTPHVLVRLQQIPAGRLKLFRIHPAAFVNLASHSASNIAQRLAPRQVAVPFDDGMSVAQFENFLRIEASVNTTEHHVRAAFPGDAANFITAKRVPGVNADAHNVARMDARGIQLLQRFIANFGVAEFGGSCSSQNK